MVYQVLVAAGIVCLQETKLEVVSQDLVCHCLGANFTDFYLLAQGTRGGILLAWDATVVHLSNPHLFDHWVTALVSPFHGQDWWFTGCTDHARAAPS